MKAMIKIILAAVGVFLFSNPALYAQEDLEKVPMWKMLAASEDIIVLRGVASEGDGIEIDVSIRERGDHDSKVIRTYSKGEFSIDRVIYAPSHLKQYVDRSIKESKRSGFIVYYPLQKNLKGDVRKFPIRDDTVVFVFSVDRLVRTLDFVYRCSIKEPHIEEAESLLEKLSKMPTREEILRVK